MGRRHGRILHADLQEGSQMFTVSAVLPVVESFDFSNEIRKQTSGKANPQLAFSHWEVSVFLSIGWFAHSLHTFNELVDSIALATTARSIHWPFLGVGMTREWFVLIESVIKHFSHSSHSSEDFSS